VKLLLESWRSHLKENNVIQGPWMSTEKKQENAIIANDIEQFIQKYMKEMYGVPELWSQEQLVTFHEIDKRLNILFPSGDSNETST